MFSLKKINDLIRCFNEIENFSLSVETQIKVSTWLKSIMQEKNKLLAENKKLKERSYDMADDRMYQSVILILQNGNKYVFTGPAIPSEEDIIVETLQITKACELPEGIDFSAMPTEQEPVVVT